MDSIAANVNAAKTGQQQEFLSWERYQQQVRGSRPGALLRCCMHTPCSGSLWCRSVPAAAAGMQQSAYCFARAPSIAYCLQGLIMPKALIQLLSAHPLTS